MRWGPFCIRRHPASGGGKAKEINRFCFVLFCFFLSCFVGRGYFFFRLSRRDYRVGGTLHEHFGKLNDDNNMAVSNFAGYDDS